MYANIVKRAHQLYPPKKMEKIDCLRDQIDMAAKIAFDEIAVRVMRCKLPDRQKVEVFEMVQRMVTEKI
jgi:hypothetical protein